MGEACYESDRILLTGSSRFGSGLGFEAGRITRLSRIHGRVRRAPIMRAPIHSHLLFDSCGTCLPMILGNSCCAICVHAYLLAGVAINIISVFVEICKSAHFAMLLGVRIWDIISEICQSPKYYKCFCGKFGVEFGIANFAIFCARDLPCLWGLRSFCVLRFY